MYYTYKYVGVSMVNYYVINYIIYVYYKINGQTNEYYYCTSTLPLNYIITRNL